MANKRLLWAFTFLMVGFCSAQQKEITVEHFEKVIISPHISVTFVAGEEEKVTIENAKVSMDKINVEVDGNTLRVYLDGAKTITKAEKINSDNWRGSKSIYDGTMVTATITYRTIKNLSIRGEEVIKSKGKWQQDALKLTIYGESKVYFDDLDLQEMIVAIYGESYLEIKAGNISRQVFRSYGESEVNTGATQNAETKITAYGESNFRINVSDVLKVTCYGETTVNYTGEAIVDQRIVIGEARIRRIG